MSSPISTKQILYLTCCYNFIFLIRCYANVDAGTDTLLQGQVLREGEYLNSANNIFKLGFFSGNTKNSKYLGIIYNADNYSVWIANRDAPVPNKSLMLMIDVSDGLIKISHAGGNAIVSNTSPVRGKNTTATILDNGNLLLRSMNLDGSINRTLWQSFDYPTDTFLPGMKLGIDFKTGQKWSLTSWMNTTTKLPGPSSFTLGGDPNGSNQLVMWRQGSVYWRSGVWESGYFSNTRFFGKDFDFMYVSNQNEKYLMYAGADVVRPLRKFRIYSEGNVMFLNADSRVYSFSACSDAENLEPSGCVVEKLPECRKVDPRFRGRRGFVNGSGFVYDQSQLSLFDCRERCRQNCSCVAFTLVNDSLTGCKIFDRVARFQPSEEYGVLVYFLEKGKARRWWPWLVAAVTGTALLFIIFFYIKRKGFAVEGREKLAEKTLLQELEETSTLSGQYRGVIDIKGTKMKSQVDLFSFERLEMATNNFSAQNKLGEGGFGSVYKGNLPSGQEIAIKRLSRSSGQGLLEFKNEILLIAKLQHDNLVKLLGCCIERQEKILVYEYMPNRSLDFFLFDPSRRESINWRNRMNIIEGVAQGLLYLHKYSRLKVIHRDLKASNILLDENMNPKISDFGMARIFGKLESEANTNRIVGTHGYMSPECMNGVISDKSDVFSFGVLLLEIVSAKKSHGCYHSQRPLNLIGLAWELWVEGRPIELVDRTLDESNNKTELLRCINIGLLCVQVNAKDRPSMTDVITKFSNKSLLLQQPKQPAFFINSSSREADREEKVEVPCTNDMSISVVDGR